MKNLIIACIAVLLAVTACGDDEWGGNPGQVLANSDELHSVLLTSAIMEVSVYGDGITDRGVCWATTDFPTVSDAHISDGNGGAGSFTVTITGLTAGTRYYARSYATYGDKTTYGSTRAFTTKPPLTVTTKAVPEDKAVMVITNITGGDERQEITERGVCYSTSADPTTGGTKVTAPQGGKGEFILTIPNLTPQTKYYIRGYAISEYGIEYSADQEVTTYPAGAPEIFWNALNESEYGTYGVVRDADGKFAMHYTMNVDNSTITITYIETTGNKDAKHETKTFTMNSEATEITWDPVSYDDKTFGGITKSGIDFAATGTGVALDKGMTTTDVNKIFLKGDNGGLGRCSETLSPRQNHPSIQSIFDSYGLMEINGGYNGLMTQYDGGFGNNWLCHEYNSDLSTVEDIATFKFKSYFWGHAENQDALTAGWAKIEPFRNLFYNTRGVYIIRELNETKTVQQGGFNYLMISTNGVEWYKWFFRVEGT